MLPPKNTDTACREGVSARPLDCLSRAQSVTITINRNPFERDISSVDRGLAAHDRTVVGEPGDDVCNAEPARRVCRLINGIDPKAYFALHPLPAFEGMPGDTTFSERGFGLFEQLERVFEAQARGVFEFQNTLIDRVAQVAEVVIRKIRDVNTGHVDPFRTTKRENPRRTGNDSERVNGGDDRI